MSTGLYSGQPGLSLGTGLYRTVSGLWSGASGFVTGWGAFSPASLFLAGEQGFIYDPSDFSTLYQDAAGTTPVTAVGQTVGLVLDKSRGLVLGPELVTNGDFSNGSTGWTLGTGWSISGGVASANTAAGSTLSQPFTTTNGKTYAVTYTITNFTSGGVRARFTGSANVNGAVRNAPGTYTEYMAATATNSNFVMVDAGAGFTGTIDNISVRELPGNHATQSVLASRPILQQDGNGKYYLLFDGSDDFLVTNTITPGTDKAQVFAGVRKLSDAAAGMLVETSPSVTANNGGLYIVAPNSNAPTYGFASRGTSLGSAVSAGFSSPATNVLTGIGDIAGDVATLRVNGVQAATSAADQGTGNYLAYPAYIGRRGGTSLPFNGRLYGLIARFGPNLSDVQIAQTEQWMNSKTGAY